jgi:predicted glycosyltransferase
VPHLDLGAARLVQLAPLRSLDESFSGLADPAGRPAAPAYLAARRTQALAALEDARPDVFVTETFPFGRRQLKDEALALVDAARAGGAGIACSVRDILQRPSKPARHRDMLAIALERYDHVMVHGDPRLVPFAATFADAGALGDRLVHTGYIAGPAGRRRTGGPGAGEIVVSVGGGATGAPLLNAALHARSKARAAAGLTWRLLVGHDLVAESLGRAPEGVVVEAARPDFADLLANGAVSVSQAGYNTAVDILAAGIRAVLVPFARGGETEQKDRATRFADLGVAIMLDEEGLTAETLARAVDRALALPAPGAHAFDLDGARKSAALLGQWSARG